MAGPKDETTAFRATTRLRGGTATHGYHARVHPFRN